MQVMHFSSTQGARFGLLSCLLLTAYTTVSQPCLLNASIVSLTANTQSSYGQQSPPIPTPQSCSTIMIDSKGHKVGLEDPDDPNVQEDPAILASMGGKIRLGWNPMRSSKSNKSDFEIEAAKKKLVQSAGKPFVDPRVYGGSFLDRISSTSHKGEPLNVAISALSSPEVLTRKGLQNYLRSINLDIECLGLHSGAPQQAFVDPRGYYNQVFEYREVYTPLDYVFGTCLESLAGGNHVRGWQQMGTGAWFLAASKEENVTKHHTIVPNGYNIGRDWVVEQSQKSGGKTSFMFNSYETKVEYLQGLMPAGAKDVNHGIATDGRVALLTVKVTATNLPVIFATTDNSAKQKLSSKEQKTREHLGRRQKDGTSKSTETSVAPKDAAKVLTSEESNTPARRTTDKMVKRLSRPFARLSTT